MQKRTGTNYFSPLLSPSKLLPLNSYAIFFLVIMLNPAWSAALTLPVQPSVSTRSDEPRISGLRASRVKRRSFFPPVAGARLTSYYSLSRLHPILRRYRPHLGIDLAAPVGTAVRAVESGIITAIRRSKSSGLRIIIAHDNGYTSKYLHLSSLWQGISTGVKVVRGQIIGRVGKSGLSTGPHLHFELVHGKRTVDPLLAGLPIEAFTIADRIAGVISSRYGISSEAAAG